jgi:hypothetical protein
MNDDTPLPEPEKPRFLLPEGCKDLIDVLRLQQRAAEEEPMDRASADMPQPLPASVALPDPVVVRDLARALRLRPFQVISRLMELGVFASINGKLDFKTASALCARLGIIATKLP